MNLFSFLELRTLQACLPYVLVSIFDHLKKFPLYSKNCHLGKKTAGLNEIKFKETMSLNHFVTRTILKLSTSYFAFSLVPLCFEQFGLYRSRHYLLKLALLASKPTERHYVTKFSVETVLKL